MKKLIDSAYLGKLLREKWHYEPKAIVPDKTKYGSEDDYQLLFNPILGLTTPKELKEAERQGAIVYQDNAWRIPVLESETVADPKRKTVRVNPVYHDFMRNRPTFTRPHPTIEFAEKLLTESPF